jgi:hypothetical protein
MQISLSKSLAFNFIIIAANYFISSCYHVCYNPVLLCSERGLFWRSSLLPGDEELYPKEALEEKGRKGQDNLIEASSDL